MKPRGGWRFRQRTRTHPTLRRRGRQRRADEHLPRRAGRKCLLNLERAAWNASRQLSALPRKHIQGKQLGVQVAQFLSQFEDLGMTSLSFQTQKVGNQAGGTFRQ